MQINQIKVSKKSRKRVGRGGKKGTYSGRGIKGQGARTGYSRRATFEGGSTGIVSLTKKLRGFKSIKKENQIVSLDKIEKKFKAEEIVDPKSLKNKGLIKKVKEKIKILSDGEITKKIYFKGVNISKVAKEKIKKAGGKVEEIKEKIQSKK